MSRPLRILFEGAWYHVMHRGINRSTIFFDDRHKNKFLEILEEINSLYLIEIHAFCLMDNHYHLLVHTPLANLSESIRHLNFKYAQYLNKDMKRDGPVFRGRFKSIVVSKDEYLIQLSRYIHLNPLSAKMIDDLSKYKWSSYPFYLQYCVPPKWLKMNVIIEIFGLSSFKNSYKSFVENNNDEFNHNNYLQNFSSVMGNQTFKEKMFDKVKLINHSSEIAGKVNILSRPTFAFILDIVAKYYKIEFKSILEFSNVQKQVVMYICRNIAGSSLNEISKLMGISNKTVSKHIKRVDAHPSLKQDAAMISQNVINSWKKYDELNLDFYARPTSTSSVET